MLIAGVDEAGRGPLAGPVVASAVILNPDYIITGLNDSKRLSPKKRETFFNIITEKSLAVGVGIVDVGEIDKINILNAALKAMNIALKNINLNPDVIYVDGNRTIPGVEITQKAIVGGDSIEPSIMAASIIAKVTRDRIMVEYSQKYDKYGFEKHKGYCTKYHINALEKYGPCSIHRKSFAPVRNLLVKESIQ
jgi:ribonuclease HII